MIRAAPFFVVTAALEIGAGLVFLVAPALVIRMLFAASDIQTGVAIGGWQARPCCRWARRAGGHAMTAAALPRVGW
jgi:hypothetical protein